MKIFKDKRTGGQAMVEMIIFLPLLAILILLIMWIGNVEMNHAFITQGARWGADLIQYRNYGYGSAATATKVKQGIQGFLGTDLQKHGRRLKQGNLIIRIVDTDGNEIENFPEFPQVKSLDASLVTHLTSMKTIGVEVYYRVTVPKMFNGFKFGDEATIVNNVQVCSRVEIISLGCGYNTLPISPE